VNPHQKNKCKSPGTFRSTSDITGYEQNVADEKVTATTMTSDEALMLEFQAGSRPAFDELFARYRDPLYGFFRRRLNSVERAEDLAQETFLAVIHASSRYEPRALVRTYLYGIALKLLAAERRKQFTNAKSEVPLEPQILEPAQDGASDLVLYVQQALQKLEEPEREIVMLREYEQLSYTEIADLLRIPVNTVRSRLFRARAALKEFLDAKPAPGSVASTTENAAERKA
jgi:RNA polymerase sigma factor (sigma-70 family)